ncbi:hypothetical protein FQN60_012430 [Etheostoma spectabile]|uniref:Pyrin domain-containing protein n=1 Tax=Etheostoma spectabile TaxID=54343 RepID=A0A5J5DPL8_9PERO|nr:hypothetical protein FQN60_012430 [Etheostoma spectabile]
MGGGRLREGDGGDARIGREGGEICDKKGGADVCMETGDEVAEFTGVVAEWEKEERNNKSLAILPSPQHPTPALRSLTILPSPHHPSPALRFLAILLQLSGPSPPYPGLVPSLHMLVQELLLETLEKLLKDDFKTFCWYLEMEVLSGCKPIPPSRLEDASRTATVNRMIESYGEESAVKVTAAILKKMNNNDAAVKLENKYTGKTAAPSASSSAAAPAAAPAAPNTLLAQQGSVIIAPQFTSSSAGSVTVNFNK